MGLVPRDGAPDMWVELIGDAPSTERLRGAMATAVWGETYGLFSRRVDCKNSTEPNLKEGGLFGSVALASRDQPSSYQSESET